MNEKKADIFQENSICKSYISNGKLLLITRCYTLLEIKLHNLEELNDPFTISKIHWFILKRFIMAWFYFDSPPSYKQQGYYKL